MTRNFGRLLQLAGLVLLPIGFSYGMFRDDLRMEVRLLAIGGILFLIGRILAARKA
jgi:hypothetical protein